jgi:hypothetical protein
MLKTEYRKKKVLCGRLISITLVIPKPFRSKLAEHNVDGATRTWSLKQKYYVVIMALFPSGSFFLLPHFFVRYRFARIICRLLEKGYVGA